MTGQVNDEFLYKGEVHVIVGISGEKEPFSPLDYGLFPRPATTACWRGYILYLAIKEDFLVLVKMVVNAEETVEINGVKPKEKEKETYRLHYQDLDLKLDYTGKLLIAKDFINEMYVHMGFQRPMAYETVIELVFENGKFTAENNLSSEMKKRRKKDRGKDAKPPSIDGDELKDWIAGTFSLDYEKEE